MLDFIRAVLLLLLLLRLLLFSLLLSSSSFSSTMSASTSFNFHIHFRLANSSPISSPTSARSGHCWTSTAGFRSEWARLDLNRQVLIAVGTAGPQPGRALRQLPCAVGTAGPQLPATNLSGHGWTSTARFRSGHRWGPSEPSGHHWTPTKNLPSPVGTTGPQPGTFRAQWAPLDLNLGPSELSGHRWTSTAR